MDNRDDFFQKIEGITRIALPDYLKKLFWYSGYDNITSLLQLNNIQSNLEELEKFARDDIFEVAEDNEILSIYSAIYKSPEVSLIKMNERKFSILLGHRKLLSAFIAKCQVEKQKLEATCSNIAGKQRGKKRFGCTCSSEGNEVTTLKRSRDDLGVDQGTTKPDKENTSQIVDNNFDQQENVIRHIHKLATEYAKRLIISKQFEIDTQNNLLEKLEKIKVQYNDGGIFIKCFMDKCEIECRVPYKLSKNGNKNYIISNFNRHLNIHLKTKSSKFLSKHQTSKSDSKVNSTNTLLPYLSIMPSTISKTLSQTTDQNTPEYTLDCRLITDLDSVVSENSNHVRNSPVTTYSEDFEQVKNISSCEGTPSNVIILQDQTISFGLTHEEAAECSYKNNNEEFLSNNNNYINNYYSNNDDPQKSQDDSFFRKCGSVEDQVTHKNSCAPANSRTRCKDYTKWKDITYSRLHRKRRASQFWNDKQRLLDDFPKFMGMLRAQVEKIFNRTVDTSDQTDPSDDTSLILNHSEDLPIAQRNIQYSNLTSLLNMLLTTYEKNASKTKFANNFNLDLKKIALFIFLNSGRYLYEILYANMKGALPSLSTLYRVLDTTVKLEEGQLRFNELKSFLLRRNLPFKIFISEDQTAIIKKIEYDSKTNKMVGFVSPLSPVTGLPEVGKFEVNSVNDIEAAFKNERLSVNSYTIIAQPLHDAAPPFCLGIFGSDNKFDGENVLKRWKYLQMEARNCGIIIEGYATDGDPRCLKAMKVLTKIPCKDENILSREYSPYFQVDFNLDDPVCIQDTVHICTKLKTRLTKPNVFLPMGIFEASTVHLETLINTVSKDQHMISSSLLNNADKMNFKSIDKLCSENVLNALPKLTGSKATRQYLLLCRYIIKAFLDKATSIKDRIYLMWYTTLFLRIWRQWLMENKHSITDNFISTNAYVCIEINAHGLLVLIEKCRKDNTPNSFVPWLYSSQPCESTFRQIRAMSTTNSTMVNFSLHEMIKRINRVQVLNDFVTDFRDKLHFPREEGRMGSGTTHTVNFPDIREIKGIINKAAVNAIFDASQLGMSTCKDACEIVNIQAAQNNDEASEEEDSEDRETANNNKMINKVDETSNLHVSETETFNAVEIKQMQKELSLFASFTDLKLRDYGDKEKSLEKGKSKLISPYLRVVLNNKKIVTVRKSSLCWFFSDQRGRLSSDRLHRVKGMSSRMSLNTSGKKVKLNLPKKDISKKKNKNYYTRKGDGLGNEADSEAITMSSKLALRMSCSEDSDDLKNSFKSEFLSDSLTQSSKVESLDQCLYIELEKYYTVFYDNRWYVGRVIHLGDNVTVKFLEEFMGIYKWPRHEDVQKVEQKFIFFGPLEFGSYPFRINSTTLRLINKKYKDFSRGLV